MSLEERRRLNRRLDDSRPPWAAFFVRHRAALTTYALALTGNEADAEDLIQDVLVRMIRQRREPEHARAYVMRCMRNRSIDMRRSRANLRRQTPEGGAAFLDAVSDDLLERERVERIRSALSSLSDEQREVIVLKTYCDMTFGEIAEILDQPPGTTASHYRRGIERLRDIYRVEADHVT